MNQTQQQNHASETAESTGKQIRGSAMLLSGRVLALAMNFAGQVMIVRFLTKLEFGSFAFVLSLISLGSSLALLGFDKTVSRFGPIYHERNDHPRLIGSIVLMLGTLLGLGTAIAMTTAASIYWLGGDLFSNPLTASLLVLLVVLVPVNALDSFLISLFAIFASPRYIFLRRYILTPGLKLLTVMVVVIGNGNVVWMAIGYTLSGVVGILFCLALLRKMVRQEGLLDQVSWSQLTLPSKEIFGFSLPLMTSDLTYLLKGTLVVLFLEFVLGSSSVAEFRAVFPLARLNEIVITTFGILFIPAASRYFARNQTGAIDDLYWQTATWITALSFPIFAACFAFSEPLTVLFFGAEYASSAPVLAFLSLGFYCNAVFGFNVHTLKVFGCVRFLVISDILAMLFAVVANLLLIPRYGVWGAAVATCGTQILQNLINQFGIMRKTSVRPFPRRCLLTYATVLLATLTLVQIQRLWAPPIALGLGMTAMFTVLVIGVSRKQLDLTNTIPQLARFPLLARVLG